MDNVYKSYSKINIGLRIMGKRPDGYHNLESIFQETTLCDQIVIRKKERGIKISTNTKALPTDERNLCFRAYCLFAEKCGLKNGVEIEIIKNIPMGSGLGGGSSNAATCLKAFNTMFDFNLSTAQLIRLAAKIGSDVPFFILGKSAIVKGRGEVVIPFSFLSNYKIIIVYPNIHISTALIYKNIEIGLTKYRSNVKFETFISKVRNLGDLKNFFHNDLEDVAKKLHPDLLEIRDRLKASGADFVSLSGSGSAMYGLYSMAADVETVKMSFIPRYYVFEAKPVI